MTTRSAIKVVGAWALVLAPLLWGVHQVVLRSLALFRSPQ